jgi:hypothetical protein
VTAGITKIVGKDITKPILRTTDGIRFKSVDEYQLHQLVTAITEGSERPEATTIRQQFVNIAGMVFDLRDTVAINVKKFATNAAKTQAYGIRVHDDLKAVVILANVEWAARQSWGTEISVAHGTIKAESLCQLVQRQPSLSSDSSNTESACNNQQRGRRPEQGQEQRPPQTAGLDSS